MPIKISATSMNNFVSCRRKYFFYKTNAFKNSLAFEFGKAYEDGLEHYINDATKEEALKFAHEKFHHGELKNIVKRELERKEELKGINPKDEIIQKYIEEKSIELITEHKLLLDDMLPRLIDFLEKEEINILQMQLTTTLTMKNGNRNEARFDGICIKDGKKYIFELKSYKKFKTYQELKHNIQLLNYTSVLKHKGENVEGILFCQVKKSVPEEPKILKGNKLSTNKAQKCRPEDYYNKACEIYGEDNIPEKVLETYTELMNKTEFIECIEVKFTDKELDDYWNQMQYLSEEMDIITKLIKDNPSEAYNRCFPSHGMSCAMCGYKLECYKGVDNG